jgi:hypothetical protein
MATIVICVLLGTCALLLGICAFMLNEIRLEVAGLIAISDQGFRDVRHDLAVEWERARALR